MTPTNTVDDLRTKFRNAYEAYVHEGWRMRELLVASDGHERAEAIKNQQKKLDEALRNYEEARAAYVNCVLAGIAGSGGTLL